MIEWSSFGVFVAAALALLLVPGPAVLYIVARSIDQGRLAGIVSVFGIATGSLVHIAAAALGVSALLISSVLAFTVVKYLGAAYLIYLGIHKLFFEKETLTEVELVQRQSLKQIYQQGVIVNILNPKSALFIFAFLPQFITAEQGSVTLQILFLGMTFVVMAIFSDSMYALLAGTLGNWLRGNLGFLRGQRYFAGTIYLLLGLTTAFSGSKK